MRDHTMFDFLVGDTPGKTVDLELAKEFAKQAAAAFLGQSKTSLNESITKIASLEGLNQDQIEIVCQEANKMVNTEMFKVAENKYVEFELADSSTISTGPVKTASVKNIDCDYELEPNEQKAYLEDFTMSKTAGHAGISDNSKNVSRAAIEKLGFAQQRLDDDILLHNSSVEALENKFVKVARDQLLPYGLKERRGTFPYIAHFCKEAGLSDERTNTLMTYLDKVMVRQGLLEKSADLKADPKLISDKLNARVVNGTHPLFIVIKTIKDKDKEEKLFEDRGNIIKEKMESYEANGAMLGTKSTKEL